MKTLKHTLQEHGLKATYQRLQVLDYLRSHHDHPTVDEIYRDLIQHNPSLSRTTIYNTIEALKAHDLISTIHITGNEVRCELQKPGHHHFYCTSCGHIIDIQVTCQFVRGAEIDGHHIDEIQGYFLGTCKHCSMS